MVAQIKDLTPALIEVFEQAVASDNGTAVIAMQPLLNAFEAVGGMLHKMDYGQGYEIDWIIDNRTIRNVATLFIDHKESAAHEKIMARALNNQTKKFINESILGKPPALAG